MRSIFIAAFSFTLAIILATGLNVSTGKNAIAQQQLDREEIGKIVREYLLENPEILLEVQQVLQTKQEAEQSEKRKNFLADNRERIFNGSFQITYGPADATKTMVEFFDYNCHFCQGAVADMERLMEGDSDLRFVLKEFPVLGQESVEAAQVSLAFGALKPELHGKFHVDLLMLEGLKNGERALQLAETMGVSREELEAEMQKPEINEAIRESYELADGLGISGTPSYVYGDEVVFGAIGHEQLKTVIANQTN